MNEAMNNLLTRRSIRRYKDTQVPDDLLDQVLEAGLYAPTGMNTQNIVMVAVRDQETRDLMSKLNAAVMGSDECRPRSGSWQLLDPPRQAGVRIPGGQGASAPLGTQRGSGGCRQLHLRLCR